jgi:hypothetical protein
MRNRHIVSTTSRVFGNRQDSRFVAGTRGGHAIALAHSIPAWHLYAGWAAWCAMAMPRALKQACSRLVRRKRLVSVTVVPVVERISDRPVPPASVGLV